MNQTDSPEYLARKSAYDRLITVYGRKPVYEILADRSLEIFRLHLADSNRGGGIVEQIKSLAAQRNIEICYHSREQLARISRNSSRTKALPVIFTAPVISPTKRPLKSSPVPISDH